MVSFKANSVAQDSHVFGGISVSPATPIFQSDYYKSVVGSRVPPSSLVSPVSHQVPCVNFSPTIGSPVSLAIPNLNTQQIGVESADGVSASSNFRSEGLISEGIGCCQDVAGSIPVDTIPVHYSKSEAMDSVVELLPGDRLCFPSQGKHLEGYDQSEVPVVSSTSSMASAGLVEGLIPVSQGVPLAGHSMVCQREQIQPPPQRSVDAVPSFDSGSGVTIGNAGGPTGITWSSVVKKNTHGDENDEMLDETG